MKKLIIIGAGGFGREVLEYALDMKEANPQIDWEVKGFIDDNLACLQQYNQEFEVIENIKDHIISNENVYICAIGDPNIKSAICKDFMDRGALFINIIHPLARVGRRCKLGVGNVICPNACLTTDVCLEDFIFVNCHSNCGHDSKISSYCTISPFCDITGFAELGKGVFLGSHASICPSVKIGDFSKIGAGAAVISDMPSDCTAVGVPAKIVKRKNR
ncbi:acetyltransferase [Aminipila luticellarii]|uniref:acetyltransferase n=1 Tax=Aminipila luticellarii TaxID=2507160 RepID=UPI0013E8A115|nr:acetyltransferase [Aminipila luticellarii]